ncbi:haloacid dehalogenase type II [Loktanella sp. R86503]|uniref:haloacid dehalogenase type II n=1 Tax=Loktanella sp. R86503 TaxID=3093847 RepID=UPI0036DE123D
MTITTCIFDAYGTLFDVNAAARRAAQEPGQERLAAVWEQLARDWRQKQLEYSWLRAVADRHCDFWQLTQDGLDWAMEAAGLDDPALRTRLLALYWELEAYPEVPAMLRTLKDRGMTTAILSNGPPDMLRAAITLAGLNDLLDDALSVEDVGVFKPHPSVYDMVGNRFGCRRDQVMFVSSNGWDAAAGAGYGFHTVWANRFGAPMDRLYARPEHVLPDLSTLPEYV